jgi:hypothetical protein
MGPYFEVEKIENSETLCWVTGADGEKQPNPLTYAMVLAGTPCGIRDITAKNAEECFTRFSIYWTLKGFTEHRPTMADVTAHIGLFTNAAALTKAQFDRSIIELARRDAGSRLWQEQNSKQ